MAQAWPRSMNKEEVDMTNPTFDKDMRYFHHRADSLETKPELLTDFITPNSQFFVCKVVDSPVVDLGTFTLKVGGDGVRRAVGFVL